MLKFFTRFVLPALMVFSFAATASANDSDIVNCNHAWKIAVLGSSTSFGTGATVYDSSWVGKFTAYVKRKNSQNEVYNFGIPGFTSYQNLCPTGYIPPANRPSPDNSFNITAALSTHPDAIIINMPSNDAANGYSLAEQQANFERTMHLADSAGVPVWVTTTQPRNNMLAAQISDLTIMRDWINTRFADKAVDFWSTVANGDGSIVNYYDYDYVHVNNLGHDLFYKRMLAENILDSLCLRITQTLVAKAGNDISVTLPATGAVLKGTGSFSSNGGVITSYSWTKISGAANAQITSPASAITNLTDLAEGRYAFALTVRDNALNVKSDTVTVIVSSRILIDFGPDITVSPDGDGKYWNTITDAQPGIKLQNAVTTGNLATNISLQVVNRIDGTFNVTGPGTNTGNTTGAINDYPATATNDFAFAETSATNGSWKISGLESTKQYTIKFWGTRSVDDNRTIQIKRADQGTWQEYNASNNSNYNTSASFSFSGKTEMSFDIRVKAGSAFGYIALIDITRTTPAVALNVAPFARANDITVPLPATSGVLDGSSSSDDDGVITNYQWVQVSGPAVAQIVSASAAITTINSLVEGVYTFKLTVTDDSSASASQVVTLTVNSRVLFDFGSTLTFGADAGGKYWNNITDGLPGVKIQNAISTGNTATSLNLEIINRIDGTFNPDGPGTNTGNTVGDVGDYPASATTDFAFAHPSATNGSYKISGLDITKQYTVKFWGARSVADERYIQIKRADEATWQQYDGQNNIDYNNAAVFTFTGKTEMFFDIKVKDNDAFGYISLIDIKITNPYINCTPLVSITSNLPSASCYGTPVTFTAIPTNGGTSPSYQWKKNGINIDGATASTYLSSTLQNNDLISCVLTANTNCVSGITAVSNEITVAVLPDVVLGVISGPTDPCPFIGGSNAVYSIPAVAGVNPYTWSVPAGATIISGQGTTSITVSFSSGFGSTGTISVYGGKCINATPSTLLLTKNIPATPGTMSGPAIACSYLGTNTQATYSIDPVAYATSYLWTLPANITLISGQGTTSINVAFNSVFTTGAISVKAISNCSVSLERTLTISTPATATPGAISGPTNPCPFIGTVNNAVYSITSVPNATVYTWSVPAGATIVSGQGTTSITVSYNSSFGTSGAISVLAGICTNGIPATLSLTKLIPAIPAAITGPMSACPYLGTTVQATYSIAVVANATSYQWTVPANVTLISGQGTTSINVTYNSAFTSGDILVKALSNCANSADKSLAISAVRLATPGAISGPTNPCPFIGTTTNAVYSIAAVPNATAYTWTVPTGATIVSGQGTTSISVSYNNNFGTTGTISVLAGPCSNGISSTLALTKTVPAIPAAISGPANACSYLGSATQVTYSITAVPNATSYLWTLPANITLVSGQGTTSIVVKFGSAFTSSAINVRAVSTCASSADKSLTVSTTVIPTPGAISGPTEACAYIGTTSTATYKINKVSVATSYIWTVPAGISIASHPAGTGVNDTIITVTFNSSFVSGSVISVQAAGCVLSPARTLSILRPLPAAPLSITIVGYPCLYQVYPVGGFSITKVSGATSYNWTIPAGATIYHYSSGANDTLIGVLFATGFSSGSISVNAVNGCGSSAATSVSVKLLNPATVSLNLSGPTDPCPYIGTSGATYKVNKVQGLASYTWTVPSTGATVVHPNGSGENDTLIIVSFTSSIGNGNITVAGNTICETSTPVKTITLTRILPSTPGTITSTLINSCPSRKYTYSIPSLPAGATSIVWTVPSGATIVSGQGTTSITVSYPSGSVSSTLSVYGKNNCANSSTKTLSVSLPACTGKREGHHDAITAEVLFTAMEVTVMPNPSYNDFKVIVSSSDRSSPVTLRLTDMSGKMVEIKTGIIAGQTISLGSGYKKGIYIGEVTQGEKRNVVKLVKL